MIIEIYTVDKYDTESNNISKLIKNHSCVDVDVKLTKLYDIKELNDKNYAMKIATNVLQDRVVESYIIRDTQIHFDNRYKFYCEIFFKKSITDVVGESVSDIIEKLYSNRFTVRTGRCFYLSSFDQNAFNFLKEEYFNELIHIMKTGDIK